MKQLEKFEKGFSDKEIEILVLTNESVKGAAVMGDMLKPSVKFIASVNLENGEFSEDKGYLEWMIEKDRTGNGWGFDFRQFEIYHLRVRKCIPENKRSAINDIFNNCYMVLEVIDDGATDSRLEELGELMSKPVIISDDKLGTFTLERDYSWFSGEIQWLGEDCMVFLETDEEDGDTAEDSLASLKKIYEDLENWDNRLRVFAAEKLTDLANDWQDDEDSVITEESFAKRITIGELSIAPDGYLTLYFDDDDMFYGHSIEITADINGEISDANIVG